MLLRTGPSPTRLRRLQLAIPIALALVVAAATASVAATWTKVASPNRGTVASVLQDVSIVPGSTTAWAVGYSYDNNVAAYRTWSSAYNGTSWSIVASPNGSANGYSQLNRVDATAASNVWAIGYDRPATSSSATTAPAGRDSAARPASSLRGMDVVGPNEAWFAGYTGSAATVVQWRTAVEDAVHAGRHRSAPPVFEAVAVAASGDVWAVGWDRDYNAPGRPVSSLVVHGQPAQWTREPRRIRRTATRSMTCRARQRRDVRGRRRPDGDRQRHHAAFAHAAPAERDLVVAERATWRGRLDRPAAVGRGRVVRAAW